MPLDLKHRPKTFEQLIGNKGIISSLTSLLENDFPNSLLLYGPSGTGKTTLARIIADELGCKGNNLVELNLSDFRGIDAARKIIEDCYLLPSIGKVRVFILDESHQATKDFQNCILKVLEEPPAHAFFILCTTDPQKLLKTIITRCNSFEIKSLNSNQIKRLINRTAEKEEIELDDESVNQLAKESEGCSRLALKILEQVQYVGKDKRLQLINSFKSQESQAIELARCLLFKKSFAELVDIFEKLDLSDSNIEKIRRTILTYAYKVALNKKINLRAFLVTSYFLEPFYNSGKAGLFYACSQLLIMD